MKRIISTFLTAIFSQGVFAFVPTQQDIIKSPYKQKMKPKPLRKSNKNTARTDILSYPGKRAVLKKDTHLMS